MVGPRNDEQGNKYETQSVTLIYKKQDASIIGEETYTQTINNTSMETFQFALSDFMLSHPELNNIQVLISGRDNGYWNGNYGMVLANGSLSITDYDPSTPAAPTTSTTTGISLGPTSTQATIKSSAQTRRDSYSGDDNGIYIDQAGSNNSITILQESENNQLRGINQQRAQMWGDFNIIDIRQGASTTTGINLIELMMDGDSNNLTLYQDRTNSGLQDSSAYGDHIIRIDLDGNLNDIDIAQRNNTTYPQGHFVDLTVAGNSNNVDVLQISDYGKDLFATITGNSNTVNVYQHGNANHFADITLTGDGHLINLEQNGTASHSATINLTNGSAPSTLNLLQDSNTPQSYSLEQTCYTAGGCSTSVTQQ